MGILPGKDPDSLEFPGFAAKALQGSLGCAVTIPASPCSLGQREEHKSVGKGRNELINEPTVNFSL